MKYKDYYKILGVDRNATEKEIKQAYKKLARKYHPDLPGGDAEKFKEINEAHEVLSNPEKRKIYDQMGSSWTGQGVGSQNFNFNGNFYTQYNINPGEFDNIFDLINSIFGSSSKRGFSSRGFSPFDFFGKQQNVRTDIGQDVESEVTISLSEYLHGTTKKVNLPYLNKDVELKIPAGVKEGSKIRFKGLGQNGGDLYLKIKIEKDPRFSIDGDNIKTTANISLFTALLGGEIPIDTPEGRVKVKVPAGSSSGTILRLKGLGALKHNKTRGDLLVNINVQVPKNLSNEEKEIVTKWAKLRGEK
ncbi:heat shock protein DnaJ domain protein [Thermodesulfobium narugense DSM 14796]|uniref:Heat shock protein DnaJ domain protein n=1 Tax=Thermodesulfobium narugense DSM 14796 TaxID=747365 RepID=M1E7D4_9BACT|nr:DnaJ C-terminal domain-containing protein [Thermodesulfobium narugense]AEE14415.1 heat shock protein DnaJ domain protein [Thermodesulfobium narugense DSM 14796]